MGNTRIATTEKSGLTVAQVGGNDIYKMLPQVQSVIELGQLGADYELLFADPVEQGRTIDWYSERDGKPVQAKDLPDDQHAELLKQFQQMTTTLSNFSDSLSRQNSQTSRSYAAIISQALNVPNLDSSLYSVDGKPVLVNWGFLQGDNELVDGRKKIIRDIEERLEKLTEKTERLSETASATDSDQTNESDQKESEDQSTESETDSGQANESDQTGSADQNTENEIEENLEQDNTISYEPESTANQEQTNQANPTSQPAVKPSSSWLPAVLTGGALVLAGAIAAWYFLIHKPSTEEHASNASLDWLKGTLQARGVMVDENNQPVNLALDFGGNDGRGTAYIVEKDQTCEGPVTAAMAADNKVLINVEELNCPNRNNYSPFSMLCTRGANTCEGTNHNGESWHIEVNMGEGK